MTRSGTSRPSFLRTWLIWTAGFLAFPIAGLAGTAVAGRVDTPVAALLGGAVSRAGHRRRPGRGQLAPTRPPPVGSGHRDRHGLGSSPRRRAVGYRTSLVDLALMGAVTGSFSVSRRRSPCPAAPTCAGPGPPRCRCCGPLGWTVTTLGGIAVDEQFTVFGAYGAVTFSALSGLLLHRLLPPRAPGVDAEPDREPHTPSAATP